ncbi:hypothetical protein QQY66_16735 [Streptomyces sp. DG2A-72]|nr:hypothetical protein [Streptomyces sp. DG2A-72]MDO0933252.1 hypothetical protein [Streptomyces sp. DG2A-72]
MWQPCVLLKYGELMLKGRDRGRFERRLIDNVRRVEDDLEYPVRIRRRGGLLLLYPSGQSELPADLLNRVRQVVGVSVAQPALRVDRTPDAAVDAALQLARQARSAAGRRVSRYGRAAVARASRSLPHSSLLWSGTGSTRNSAGPSI